VAFRVLAPPDMPNALKTKAISGAVVSEGFGAASEIFADSTLLRMSGDVWRNHPCCQSTLMQRTIDKDPSWAQAVTNAIVRACAWCEENPEETAEILAKDGGGYFPMPKKIMKRAILHVDLKEYGVKTGTGAIRHPEWNVKRLAFNPYPYPSAFELAVSLMKKNKVDPVVALSQKLLKLDPKKAAQDIVDYKMITGAIKKAGGLKQFSNVNPADPLNRKEEFDVKPLT
jgi:NitT/TauT family transport system substrate-binding protein